uniref:Uncharacterized protein n=1 Tax=Caenorhabditis japonica TaxID=281687 RepID=A0A8R1IPZ1_CAEJA
MDTDRECSGQKIMRNVKWGTERDSVDSPIEVASVHDIFILPTQAREACAWEDGDVVTYEKWVCVSQM